MATRFALTPFNAADDPLVKLGVDHRQAVYLRHYLADQDAKTVLVEPAYFDRDFLSEFAAFYGVSSRGSEPMHPLPLL